MNGRGEVPGGVTPDPGDGITFKIHVKIRQSRTYAEQTLGGRFDVREFHEVVLRDERVPLDLLDERVREWVREKQSARQ